MAPILAVVLRFGAQMTTIFKLTLITGGYLCAKMEHLLVPWCKKFESDTHYNRSQVQSSALRIVPLKQEALEIIMWERLFELRHSLFAGGSDRGWKTAPTIKTKQL